MNSGSKISLGVFAAIGAVTSVAILRMIRESHKRSSTKELIQREAGFELSNLQAWLFDNASKGIDHIVACVEISGEIPTRTALDAAIERTKRQDSMLDYAAVNDNNMYLLRKIPGVCGNVEVIINEDWKMVAHRRLNEIHFPKPTKNPIPTWKVVLVKNTARSSSSSALIFVLHHVLFDGTSRNRLIRTVLESLADPAATAPAVPEVPATEIDKYKKYLSWWGLLAQCANKFKFQYRNRRIPPCFMDLSRAPGLTDLGTPKETRQILVQLSKQETDAVIQRSKSEGTTVHGALTAAVLLALAQFGYNDGRVQTASCTHLISLWNQLQDHIPRHSLTGCYISDTRTNTVVDNANPWETARQVKAELKDFALLKVSQFHWFRLYRRLLERSFGKQPPAEYGKLQRIPAMAISNNGKVDFCESYAGTKVEGCYATSARHNAPGNIATLNVQTVSGKVCITMSYSSQVWTNETANDYVKLLCQTLNDISSPNSCM